MNMNRRQFIASLGGAGLCYAFRFTSGNGTQTGGFETLPVDLDDHGCLATTANVDYTDWIVFGPGDKVSVFTGRTELGQGLKTVITAIVTQGLEVSQANLNVVLGDTALCPDDGITSGSSSTRAVGWGFWLACGKIRADIVKRASRYLSIPEDELEFREGGIGRTGEPGKLLDSSELGRGETMLMDINTKEAGAAGKTYTDLKIPNVNANQIVTGGLKYVGDVKKPGMLYAGWLCPPYHRAQTKLQSIDVSEAETIPGVKKVEVINGWVAVFGERYSDVVKGLDLIKATWLTPTRPKELPLEEARANAKLHEIKEQQGDINAGLSASDFTYSETYTTQYICHCQLETDMSVAQIDSGGKVTIWASTQHAHMARQMTADYLKIPGANVRVIALPAGGAFGGKQANPVNREAAKLAGLVNTPLKLIYSRKDQFRFRSLFKAACIIEVTSGVTSDGKILARKVDSYQDVGDGTKHTYSIPHVLVKAFKADKWPLGIASVRGTSYVQTCFATESHIDMLAHKLGIDPLEFRRKNVELPAFIHLIDACAEMIGYDKNELEQDEGIGLAIVLHAAAQLGAVAAKVAVDRNSGRIKVKHLCGAFDIGTVINYNTATVGLRGGMAWGIGYALQEEIKLDGHSTQTEFFGHYKIARFSDMPPIDMVFLNNHLPDGGPRGCGEMPVIPTIGAIANAVYNAVGVRFYSTPITPEKVKKALGTT